MISGGGVVMSIEKPHKTITTLVVAATTAVMVFYSEQAFAGDNVPSVIIEMDFRLDIRGYDLSLACLV